MKLSPDLPPDRLDPVLQAVIDSLAAGVILSNTSTDRSGLRSPSAAEEGGLSGRPLRARMLASVERAREIGGSRLAIAASGGIDADAPEVPTGADLAQIWTGMIYAGPGLIGETVRR